MPNLVIELLDALKAQAMPFLSRVDSLDDFVEMARSSSTSNPHTSKAIAFALARVGRVQEALEILERLPSQLDLGVGWQRGIADEARALSAKLVASAAHAQKELEAWETETIHNLKLWGLRECGRESPNR